MVLATRTIILIVVTVLCSLADVEAIRCFQCSTDTDPKGSDLCGAYNKFDQEKNFPIECNSLDSPTLGTFCVKVTVQSPRGFIWDGRWRQVIRRCASKTETGTIGICTWEVHDNGDYEETCSCSEDGCNGASSIFGKSTIFLVACAIIYSIFSRT